MRSNAGSEEMHLEFTGGTAFSLQIQPTTPGNAHLIVQSDGSPEPIRSYDE